LVLKASHAQGEEEMRPMRGRVCVVTGATAGIGLATAEALARLGATVVAVGRNAEAGERLADRLREETGNVQIEFLRADLSLQSEVRALAAGVLRRHARLHVLVNNVGAYFLGRRMTAEGFEATFALNYWNVFLLTRLLLEALQAGVPSRIVNVSSDSHRGARLDLAAVARACGGSGLNAYGQSKVALTSFTYELARRLEGSGVTVNAVHPGFVASSMYEDIALLRRVVAPVVRRVGKPVEAGADTVVYLAAAPEVGGVTGKYVVDRKAVRSAPATYDEDLAGRLWELSEKMVGLG
jgi:NAD(P)-dependent dehydrogenase (short-subunit alcohol dehydrogenase family)